MNKYILILLFIVSNLRVLSQSEFSKAQSAYYDALFLSTHFTQRNTPSGLGIKTFDLGNDTTKLILIKYFDTLHNGTFDTSNFKLNPFLNDYTTSNAAKVSWTINPANFSSVLSSIGGLDVTNIADGLAKFLVKRTKQELTVSFFSKFDSLIAKYPDLRTVFPQTYQSLTIIGDEIYNYQGYIQTLRESFEKDLQNLNTNLPTIIDNHPTFFSAHKDLAATLKSGCYIAGGLRDKVHPGDILANYPADYLDSLNPNWKGTIQTLQLISSSLRDTASNNNNTDSVGYWVSIKQVKQLVTDPITFKIYLGLIYQQALIFDRDANHNPVQITFQGKTLNEILDSVAPTYMQMSTFITNFGSKADKLNTLIKQYQRQTTDSLLIQQYYNYATATVDLFKQAATITNIPIVRKVLNMNLTDTLQDYFDVAQSASDLVLNISKRNYSAAVVNVTHIYDVVIARKTKYYATLYPISNDGSKALKHLKKNVKRAVKQSKDISSLQTVDIKTIADTSLSNDLRNALRNADTLASFNDVSKVQSYIFKYGSFMATMAQAQSSDDVENAIEAFALPAGSARIKRETPFNVSLNAYTGLYGGYERIKGIDQGCWHFNSAGVTVPIGVAVSKGIKHWSYSLFLSIIDLGAVASFRFGDDSTIIKNNNATDTLSTSQSPSIQLENIISPGLFLSIGIPKSPLSVNFGAQMGPNLRSITSSNSTSQLDFSNNIYWRYSVSLCVDIPVLNFYTKSK